MLMTRFFVSAASLAGAETPGHEAVNEVLTGRQRLLWGAFSDSVDSSVDASDKAWNLAGFGSPVRTARGSRRRSRRGSRRGNAGRPSGPVWGQTPAPAPVWGGDSRQSANGFGSISTTTGCGINDRIMGNINCKCQSTIVTGPCWCTTQSGLGGPDRGGYDRGAVCNVGRTCTHPIFGFGTSTCS